MITTLDHLIIAVDDLDKAEKDYIKIFGIQPVGWAWGLAGTSLAATAARPLLPLNADGLAVGSARLLACGVPPATAVVLGDTAELSDTVLQRHLACPVEG